jgi:hypothetical protein
MQDDKEKPFYTSFLPSWTCERPANAKAFDVM